MSIMQAASKIRTLSILAGCLPCLFLIPGLCLADSAGVALPTDTPTLVSEDPIPEPQQPLLEPEEEAAACPIRDEDLGQAVSRVDTSFLPQHTLFAVEKINRWGGGDDGMCEVSICCGLEHCQWPAVAPDCTGSCNLTTFLCEVD